MWRLVGGIVAVATVGYSYFKKKSKLDPEAEKKITILGDSSTGKTTYINYLRGLDEDEAIKTTVTLTSKKYKKLKIGNDTYNIIDNGGVKENYKTWENEVNSSDYLIYFFNISKIEEEETLHKIKDDMMQIHGWIKNNENIKKIFIVGTHCDLLKVSCDDKYEQVFRSSDIYGIMEMNLGGSEKVRLILGYLHKKRGFKRIQEQIEKVMEDE